MPTKEEKIKEIIKANACSYWLQEDALSKQMVHQNSFTKLEKEMLAWHESELAKQREEDIRTFKRSTKYRGDGDFTNPEYCVWFGGYREAIRDLETQLKGGEDE